MAKRSEELPIEKVTIRLYEGDSARLQRLYPKVGASKVIRHLVRHHLRGVDERTEQILQMQAED